MTDTRAFFRAIGLTKSVAGRELVTDCTISLFPGEICAIIGPNGAGKTTLFKMLAGLTIPTSGTIRFEGELFDSASQSEILPRIGSMIDAPEFRAKATAREVLQLHIDMLGIRPETSIQEQLNTVGLAGAGDSPVASFSLGMKQRLAFARATFHQPTLLLLDEPANGLDPDGATELRRALTDTASQGTGVLVASHILSELERSVHSVAVLSNGYLGTKRSLPEVLDEHAGSLENFYRSATN